MTVRLLVAHDGHPVNTLYTGPDEATLKANGLAEAYDAALGGYVPSAEGIGGGSGDIQKATLKATVRTLGGVASDELVGAAAKQTIDSRPPSAIPNQKGSIFDITSWTKRKLYDITATPGRLGLLGSQIIKDDLATDPAKQWVLFDSTDHAIDAGGISWFTAPKPEGPWTYQGLAYTDISTANGQTETPCVIYDSYLNNYRMFYQQRSARYGAGSELLGGGTQAIGEQSTLSATANTLSGPWTKDTSGFVLDTLQGGKTPAPGHTGYFYSFQTKRGRFAYSLMRAGGFADFMMWRCPAESNVWIPDWRPLDSCIYLTQGGDLEGRAVEWNSCFVFETSSGQEFLCGYLTTGQGGTDIADRKIFIAPVSADYRRITGRPRIIHNPDQSWETPFGRDIRSCTGLNDNGILYITYTMGISVVGQLSRYV